MNETKVSSARQLLPPALLLALLTALFLYWEDLVEASGLEELATGPHRAEAQDLGKKILDKLKSFFGI